MWTVIITLLAIALAVIVIFAIGAASKKKASLAHDRLDEDYTYRKEPHADQVAEKPNQLHDNELTDVKQKKK